MNPTKHELREKRQPTLADRFLRSRFDRNPLSAAGMRYARAIHQRIRQAHRFTFGPEASARVGAVVREIPDLLVREIQFARAPFDITWVEYDADAYWEALHDLSVADMPHPETRDRYVGYLVDHNRVNVISASEGDQFCGMMPVVYHLNTEWPLEDQIRFCNMMQCARSGIDGWLWGQTSQRFARDSASLRTLRDHTMAELLIDDPSYWREEITSQFGTLRARAHSLLLGSAGDLRTVVALLLMLNRPSISKYLHHHKNSRGWMGNKPVPFLGHTTIEVSLDAVKTLKLVGTSRGESIPKRRHEVRGHYCHDQTARDYGRIAGCVHTWCATGGPEDQWKPTTDPATETNHWVCDTCGGKRWWRAEMFRGTAEKGFVVNEGYEVNE